MNIWVFAQGTNGAPSSATLELLTKGRSLGHVTAFVAGEATALAPALGEYGASKVYATGHLNGKLAGVVVATVMKAIIDGGDSPDLIMFPQNYEGRDIISRLSVKLDRTVLTNNIDVSADEGVVTVTTPILGGDTLVTTSFSGPGPHLAAFRAKSFPMESAGGASPEIIVANPPELGATAGATVAASHVEETHGPKLDEAAIVVSGGRGLGEADKYKMVETLAQLLKGAPGASRAIVDAGWVPYSYQVGQTGKVVKPTVYIAAGISGATQHTVGMKGAKNVIAINKDRESPIFGIADLGVVGDVHTVVPKLIEALRNR